jgi:drug/metabolite transporter (DMT)-like permease
MPFVVALLSIAVDRSEHVTGWQVGGLAIGIGGVAVLLGFGGRDRESLLGAALVAAATVLYSVGALAVKRWLADVPLRASAAATLVIAAVALAPGAIATPPMHFPRVASLLAIAGLGLICTAAAYLLYFRLIADAGATCAAVVTYVNPVVAVLLGVLLLHEPMTASVMAGLLLVLFGSWLSTGGKPPRLDALRRLLQGYAV